MQHYIRHKPERDYNMKFKLKKGRIYWYVADSHEVFFEIPVIYNGDYLFWHLGDGLYEMFIKFDPQRLFKCRRQASKAATILTAKGG